MPSATPASASTIESIRSSSCSPYSLAIKRGFVFGFRARLAACRSTKNYRC
jgi:hypothetical protein